MSYLKKISLGGWMVVCAWLIILALMSYFFYHWNERQYNPNQTLQTSVDATGVKHVSIVANRWQQYILPGQINGVNVTFLVDTGATQVVVPETLAERLQLKKGFKSFAQTANGIIEVYGTQLDELVIGNIILHKVRANINPYSEDDTILLGMSVLKRLDFHQRGDTLTLSAK